MYEIIPGATDASLTKNGFKKRKSCVAPARPGGTLPAQSGGKPKVQRPAVARRRCDHGCGPRDMRSAKTFQNDHGCTVDASRSTFENLDRTCRSAPDVKPEPVPSNHRTQPVKWTLGQGVGAGSCDSICEAKGDFLLRPGVRWACVQDALMALHDAVAASVHGAFLSTMDADSQLNNDMILKTTSFWQNSLANDNKRIEPVERGPRQPGWVKSEPGEFPQENFAPMVPGCVREAAPYVDRALPEQAAPDSPATALHAALC